MRLAAPGAPIAARANNNDAAARHRRATEARLSGLQTCWRRACDTLRRG